MSRHRGERLICGMGSAVCCSLKVVNHYCFSSELPSSNHNQSTISRLRLDFGNQGGPAAPGSEKDTAAAAQAAEWRAREVALWVDQPLTYAEFVLGLTRLAALAPPPARPRLTAGLRQQAAASAVTRVSTVGAAAAEERQVGVSLITMLQRLLEGPRGVLVRLGGGAGEEEGEGGAAEEQEGAEREAAR